MYPTIDCGNCGHRFPLDFVRSRGQVMCACGMRLVPPQEGVRRHAVRNLTLVLVALSLLGAAAEVARRMVG
jgi:hypothetical protein